MMDLIREIDKLLARAQRQSEDLNDQRDHGRVDGLEEARELAVAYVRELEEENRKLSEQAGLWKARVDRLEDANRMIRDARDRERIDAARNYAQLTEES